MASEGKRRFKITVHEGDDPWGSPRWDVIDTKKDLRFGPFASSEEARADATKRAAIAKATGSPHGE